jgi:hypothetical protein
MCDLINAVELAWGNETSCEFSHHRWRYDNA